MKAQDVELQQNQFMESGKCQVREASQFCDDVYSCTILKCCCPKNMSSKQFYAP